MASEVDWPCGHLHIDTTCLSPGQCLHCLSDIPVGWVPSGMLHVRYEVRFYADIPS